MGITKFSNIMYGARDMEKSIEFYRDVLGLKMRFSSPDWTEFEQDGVTLALHGAPEEGKKRTDIAEWRVVGFHVDDIRAFKAHLEEKGVTILGDLHEIPGGLLITFLDPSGNPIQVAEMVEAQEQK